MLFKVRDKAYFTSHTCMNGSKFTREGNPGRLSTSKGQGEGREGELFFFFLPFAGEDKKSNTQDSLSLSLSLSLNFYYGEEEGQGQTNTCKVDVFRKRGRVGTGEVTRGRHLGGGREECM